MPRKGSKRTKTRTHKKQGLANAPVEEEKQKGLDDIPKSIVAKISKVNSNVEELLRDIRKIMEPNTASKLREKSFNRVKDYISVAGQLGVTHLLAISQTSSNILMKIARVPNGPTLHFKIKKYTLAHQVKSSLKKPYNSPAAFLTAPLVVLNNFSQSEESHVKLLRVTFQNMFPTINVKTVRLSECRRVVLFHFNKEEDLIEMRHYAVKANPVGISRSVKKVLQSKVPDLGKLKDISDFVEGGSGLSGVVSDSEAEDENTRVTLPDRFIGKGNAKAQQSAMKLVELGPRLSLELFKVEQGVTEGDILYHKYIHKTPEEAAKIKAKVNKMKQLKEQRKAIQNANVKRKREEEEEKLAKKAEKKKMRLENQKERSEESAGSDNDENQDDDESDDDDENQEFADDDEDEFSAGNSEEEMEE